MQYFSVFTFQYTRVKWRERGLNWFLFDEVSSPTLLSVAFYCDLLLVFFTFVLIFLPFAHMLFIVYRYFFCCLEFFDCDCVDRARRFSLLHREAQTCTYDKRERSLFRLDICSSCFDLGLSRRNGLYYLHDISVSVFGPNYVRRDSLRCYNDCSDSRRLHEHSEFVSLL